MPDLCLLLDLRPRQEVLVVLVCQLAVVEEQGSDLDRLFLLASGRDDVDGVEVLDVALLHVLLPCNGIVLLALVLVVSHVAERKTRLFVVIDGRLCSSLAALPLWAQVLILDVAILKLP